MIYLDYQATTPLAPEAREAMLRWLDGPDGASFANPHSPHRMGREAAAAVELARDRVAALLPAGGRVIFTGNACEAVNLAMRGSLGRRKPGMAISAIEHASVWDTAKALGGANDLPQDAIEKLQYDLFYVKNHSLLFYLAILVQTVEVIVWRKGAR